jgi:hypothetical protein
VEMALARAAQVVEVEAEEVVVTMDTKGDHHFQCGHSVEMDQDLPVALGLVVTKCHLVK